MIITKEEFDKRLDDTLEDARMWCWCDSEGCEGSRQRVNAKQALRQLMLDMISDLEEEAECMPKPNGDYVDVLPILHIEELREIVKGE